MINSLTFGQWVRPRQIVLGGSMETTKQLVSQLHYDLQTRAQDLPRDARNGDVDALSGFLQGWLLQLKMTGILTEFSLPFDAGSNREGFLSIATYDTDELRKYRGIVLLPGHSFTGRQRSTLVVIRGEKASWALLEADQDENPRFQEITSLELAELLILEVDNLVNIFNAMTDHLVICCRRRMERLLETSCQVALFKQVADLYGDSISAPPGKPRRN